MALWETNNDIARDLDVLSGFKTSSGIVKSYTSWGRGKNHEDVEVPEVPFTEKKPQEEFQWFKKREMGKLPDSLSRGKKLEILKENCFYKGKELEVREQLRAAMGPGYSNELIEDTFKQRMQHLGVTDTKDLPYIQFEDSEIGLLGGPANTSSKILTMPSNNTETVKVINKKSKKRPRRFRNAVLESLEKMHSSEELKDSNVDTLLSSNPPQIKESIGESTLKNIPPACYVPFKRKTNSFEYSDADFPKL